MEFHEKLVELRRGNHMTQAGLASALGVTRQTVYKWETGQSYPEAMTLFAMRNLFNVPTDILLDNTVTLAEYKESLAGGTVATECNAIPGTAAEKQEENPAPAAEEMTAPAKEKPIREEAAKEAPTASAEPEKKKKGLLYRLFNR